MSGLWKGICAALLLLSSVVQAGYADSSDSERSIKCVTAFDFDLTLRVPRSSGNHIDYDGPAPEGRQVLKAAQREPCAIAVASANSNKQKITSVLNRLYPDVFTDKFFQTPAFQYGTYDKAGELQRIAGYFSVPTRCIVLFDDTEHNRNYADKTGSHFELVKRDTGVQMWNYWNAISALPAECFSQERPDRG